MLEHGGRLIGGARVTGLERSGDRISTVRYERGGRVEELQADAVISTIALPAVARMLGGRGLPDDVARAGERLRFRAIRLCNVLLDLPEVSPHTWMYVSEPRYLMARIQEPRQRSPFAAPAGKTSLMLEIPCAVGDATWRAPDDEIYARCMRDLRSLGLRNIEEATLGHFSTYVEEGYPIYHLDYQNDRNRLLSFVGATSNLISCGRQGAFRYIFMDTAMEMGIAAATAVLRRDGAGGRPIAELRSEAGLVESLALTA
jgi:protoporphyrinogen oxidase